jgi:uncharacterized membrane protein
MGTLTVWRFDTAEGADEATRVLSDLSAQHLITIIDAATGSRPELIFTNLSDEQETALREVFAEQDE